MRPIYSAPSRKRLVAELGITVKQADYIRDLLDGNYHTQAEIDRLDVPNGERIKRYSYPERVLHIIDHVIETHGVESFATTRQHYEYCNAGDTYASTIIYCHGSDTFRLTDFGHIAEREPSRDVQDALLNGY